MDERLDLDALQKQMGELINSKQVNNSDCLCVIASVLIDIADSLRRSAMR